MNRPLRVLASSSAALCVAAALVWCAPGAHAQQSGLTDIPIPTDTMHGLGTVTERRAWHAFERNERILARELGERAVAENPRSFIGHFVLGLVQHYTEANFPRALYHENLALQIFEETYNSSPGGEMPWRWHSRMLRELAATHGDLEHHAERIAFLERFNERYRPRQVAELAWSLLKLGRFDDARRAAQEGLAQGTPGQTVIGLNALCAIEFEAGDIDASYRACNAAVAHARQQGRVAVVDLTNLAEASRSVLRLDDAERLLLEAADAEVSWYGNPYLELAELYTRGGRFVEAASALKRIPAYRARRPPHVRDADRNEVRRGLTGFLLVAGMHDDAMRYTGDALFAPDRRSHNSRDPAQDRSVTALLDRRARLVGADVLQEEVTARPFYERWWAFARAQLLKVEAFMSGRRAAQLLVREDRLAGAIQFGTSRGAITPPWLAGDLVEVFGAGVMRAAIRDARAQDPREVARPYYDALQAEAHFASGDETEGLRLARSALGGIGQGDTLLRARVQALVATAETAGSGPTTDHETVLGSDPGVYRRLGLSLPVRIQHTSGVVPALVADAIGRSPRFHVDRSSTLTVDVQATAAGGRVCLLGAHGRQLGCGDGGVAHDEDDVDAVVQRIVTAFHDAVFAPRVSLSQSDLNGLDGSNGAARGATTDALRVTPDAP